MSPFDTFLAACEAKGRKVSRRGDSAMVQCPAAGHDDHNPSLAASQTPKGNLLVDCKSRRCSFEDIMAGAGLSPSDAFADNGHKPKATERPTLEATYRYTDEDGRLLYEVLRKRRPDGGKTFTQRRPKPGGGWDYTLGDVRRVLYRLDRVQEAIAGGETIYFPEGEKCVHALEAIGLTATTNSGGVDGWRPELAEQLAGAQEVVVLPDEDEVGEQLARAKLIALKAEVKHLRVARVALSHDKADIADHLAAGHTLDDLECVDVDEFLRAAPEVAPEQVEGDEEDEEVEDGPRPLVWADLWAEDHDDGAEWFVDPLIPARRQVAMFSSAKAGKSLLALEVAAARATGRAVLDQPAGDPVDVVYIDLEMTREDVRDRLSDLGYGPDDDLSRLHYYLLPDLPPLDTKKGGEALLALAVAHGAELVVVDTMARGVDGDEDKSDTYRAFFRHTGRRLKAAGIALWRLDHAGKDVSRGQRGSSGKNDDVDLVWRLTVDQNIVTLKATHRRVPWVPEEVKLTREEEPVLRHRWDNLAWPMGTAEAAADLELLEVPLDAAVRTAMTALRKADKGRRQAVVQAAIKYRRQRDTRRDTRSADACPDTRGTRDG